MAERLNMAGEGGSSPETGPGPEGAPPGIEAQNQTPTSGEKTSQRSWWTSPKYNKNRAEGYVRIQDGAYINFFDPETNEKVAWILQTVGASIGGPPEGPQSPEPARGPEWETSPERGREIVNEIIKLETTPYTERYSVRAGLLSTSNPEIYNERNGTYLDQLYKDLQDYTRAVRRIRNERDRWNPINAYKKIKETIKRIAGGEQISEVVQRLTGRTRNRGERPLEAEIPAESLNDLYEQYLQGRAPESVVQNMAIYFREARYSGLLDRADDIFNAALKRIQEGGLSDDDQQSLLEENTQKARRTIEGVLRASGGNPDLNRDRLVRIAEAYTQRTKDLFDRYLSGDPVNLKEGEFRFGQDLDEEDDTKTYWRPGHWPKTYEILAKTPKQLRRAVDSFLSTVTSGRLGKAPDQLYEHFNNFTEKIEQTASAENMEKQFSIDLKQELEGHGFVFGGDYSFETYNMKSANQFLMAMALHEGPQRWVVVARSGRGGVAANLWKFDYDPRVKLMHNPGGSRGQLLNDTVTQHYLHQEIRNILIEEGMGVVLKDYRPDAQYLTDNPEVAELSQNFSRIQSQLDNGGSLDQLSEQDQNIYLTALPILRTEEELKANLERIGIHQKAEEFKGLYEGFYDGGAHIANFRKFGNIDQKRLPSDLRRSVIVGKVQFLLQDLGGHGLGDENKDKLIEVINQLIIDKRLTDMDKRFWEEAYDQSKANFATAFQMVGATGEKARRGGGVFFIDRKDEHGHRFVDNMPVYLGEMFIQYAENRTKIEYSDESNVWDKNGFNTKGYIEITNEDGKKEKLLTKAAYRTYMVGKARTNAINQIKTNGFEANLAFSKLLFNTNTDENSPNFGGVIGLDGDQTETVDFDTATDPENPLNKWLNHTYLSYQPENRHQVTNPDVLKAAKRRRIRLLRPDLVTGPDQDQYENLADIRLILDPTLNRVASLQDTDMPEGMSAQQAEILLSDAAVEASNYGHWRIVRELNAVFMDPKGNPFKMRTGYNLEDYSGIARFIIRMRQFVASNPKRFARRYSAEIANLPLNVSSMPDQWGQGGVLGAIEMFADPVGKMAEQREASQFAITKWVEQMRIGNMLFGALVGQVDPERGFSIEGLFEKPTNNAEKITKIQDNLGKLNSNSNNPKAVDYVAENQFMELVLESFDRLWIVLKLVRTMESDTRNAQGALNLEKKDFFKNGKLDAELLEKLAEDNNTGSSRHTEEQFFNAYIKWLTEGPGAESYSLENAWYKKLLEISPLDSERKMTRAQWLFRKMGR